ncbi:hypothetical protein YC2023_121342 [Brassica napus]
MRLLSYGTTASLNQSKMGKDDLPPLGGKPHGKEKVPNKYRKTAAAARENPPTD